MEIVLNGSAYPLAELQTVEQLIARLELTGKAVAVAVNRQVISTHQWAQHILLHEDKVDIVRAIGGG